MDGVTFRTALIDTDAESIAHLISAFETEPVSAQTISTWFAHQPPGRITHRMVAVLDGQVVGYGMAAHETWKPPGEFYLWVTVEKAWQCKGIGSQLMDLLLDACTAHGLNALTSEVLEADPASLAFAQRRGFAVDHHLYESVLDLTRFDESPYLSLRSNLEQAGCRFFTLAEADEPDALKRLYALNRATSLDIPGASVEFESYEEYAEWVLHADWFNPAGQLFVAEGDQWVGMSTVQLLSNGIGAYNLMTGVLPAWRGRGIATALKIEAIRYAKMNGRSYIRTHNDSLNAPMLSVNRKLGYVPQPGKFLLRAQYLIRNTDLPITDN